MSNTINLGGMAGYYNSLIQSAGVRRSSGTKTVESQIRVAETKTDFLETVKEKAEVSSRSFVILHNRIRAFHTQIEVFRSFDMEKMN